LAMSHTTRSAMVVVLPDPAPATTRSGAGPASMTARCSGVGVGSPSRLARPTALCAGCSVIGDLPSLFGQRAAVPDRAGGALVGVPGLEGGRAHLAGGVVDQFGDPLGVRGVAEGTLRERLGPGLVLHAGVDQLGPARLGALREGALGDRELVGAHLRVLLGLPLAGRVLAALEVDDVDAAVLVAFEPVDLPGHDHFDAGRPELEADAEGALGAEQLPLVGPQPVGEAFDGAVDAAALLLGLPGRLEGQASEMLVDDVANDLGGVGVGGLGDGFGGGVQEGAHV